MLALPIGLTAALTLSACGGGGEDGDIELVVATFNEMGYEELLEEYEEANPGITVTHRKTGAAESHHQSLFTRINAGSGLADVEAVEEGYMAQAMEASGRFNDLAEIGPDDVSPDRWLDWKYEAGVTPDGKLIGYGTDIGPLAMCYRADLLEDAGLPSDPAEVGELFATWDSYFAAGDEFVAANQDSAWFDTGAQVFNAMHNQLETGYYDTDSNVVIESNTAIKDNWDQVVAAVEGGQSAGLEAFSPAWDTSFGDDAFATKTCPPWMLGQIEGLAGEDKVWRVAEGFPEGGGNWGGTWLTVPTQSDHPEEAAALAAWLTAPEQQTRAFVASGPFPSQVEALESDELLALTNEYFDVETGALYAEQAAAVGPAQFKGPRDGQIQTNVLTPALTSVEEGTASPDEAWDAVVSGAENLAG
ncbi:MULTISPECIES: ABC transporter substrate-binding protein [Actinoalloteichus]|nr:MULTISPECIES: ABC transporter substrate-binding protein [Actinoalloteichus]